MKTILITGATSGIGQATARKFNQTGFNLILCGRRKERFKALKKTITVPYLTYEADVKSYRNLRNQLSNLPAEFSKIDVLINNAGLALGLDAAQIASLEDWENMIDTNIKGFSGYIHAILPQMVERNEGHIINIGSIAAVNPYKGGNIYGATKAFVHQFSANLRNDLLGTNVRVTVIAPGLTQTDFFEVRFKGDKSRANAVFDGIQALTPENIADAIFWTTQQPPNVNVNLIELMPICQVPGNVTPYRASAFKAS